MKFPPYLSAGAHVAIISPAGRIDRQVAERGAELLRQHGLVVALGSHAFDEAGVFAGRDTARAADMQQALDDPSIMAIFFARGGYGCLRTHLLLDWTAFLAQPKWLVGFSDTTVFHAFLARHHIASIHGVMTAWFQHDGVASDDFLRLLDLLGGRPPEYHIPAHPLNRTGVGSGILTGGNLSIIQSLRGTPLDIEPAGKILFLEDLGEHHYHLDRMLQNLRAGGVLEQLSGLIVGHFTGMKDGETPFGQTACEIIKEAVAAYAYPVAFGFPAGHAVPNLPLLMGGRVGLKVSETAAIIQIQ
ncbi:MAG: LD-carboxypeptidase [Verrucomicrobiota bacterium]